MTSRALVLEDLFVQRQLDIIFIQEGRLQGSAVHPSFNYKMFRSGASEAGAQGSQIWLSLGIAPFVVAARPVNPRILALYLNIADVEIQLISGHAPIEDADESEKNCFWSQIEHLIASFNVPDKLRLSFMGIDANGKLGSVITPCVGPCEPDVENFNGYALRETATSFDLAVLNTYTCAGTTWTGSRGHKSRIDYLLSSSWARAAACETFVDYSLDLATSVRDDHNIVVSRFSGLSKIIAEKRASLTSNCAPSKSVESKGAVKFDRMYFKDPAYCSYFRGLVDELPMFPGTVGVADHRTACLEIDAAAEGLAKGVLNASIHTFPTQASAPRKSWISTCTWVVIQQSNWSRSQLRRHRARCTKFFCAFIFGAWVSTSRVSDASASGQWSRISSPVASTPFSRNCVTEFESRDRRLQWWCAAWELTLRRICRLKGPMILRDKRLSLQNLASEAQAAAHDPKKLYSIARSLGGMKSRPLDGIDDENGEAATEKDKITECWRTHFTSLFRGKVIHDLSECDHCPAHLPHGCSVVATPVGFAPSVEKVEDAIRRLKHSGVGDDAVAAIQLQAGGRPLALRLHAIIIDMCRRGYIPIVWRGGRLVVLFKKGSMRNMGNYRGILVSDHLSKVVTRLLYDHVVDSYNVLIGTSQFGAAKHRGTALASLLLRSFAFSAVALELSWAVLFLDLSKAFDLAVREIVLGWMQGDALDNVADKVNLLISVGIPAELAGDLVAWIDENNGLLGTCSHVESNAQAMVNSLHSKSWFRLSNDSEYIQTSAGGRQGCILGPVLFNLVYCVALLRTKRALAAKGVLVKVVLRDSRPFWASAGSSWSWASDPDNCTDDVFEVAFVDDVAAMLSACSAAALMSILPTFISELCLVLRSLGFMVNWGEGKTEAFVSLRGRKSIEISRELVGAGNVVPINPLCGADSVRLVSQYKHLGSMVDSSMSHNPDVEYRVQRAMASYVPIAFKVFGARQISRPVRLRLFFALIISRLVYNVHVWANIPLRHYRRLNSVYMRGLRMIAGKSRFSAESSAGVTDHDIRYQLGAMSLQCMLTRRRLLLLCQVVCHGNFQLHALLATTKRDGSRIPWVQLIIADLKLLYKHMYNKLAWLGDPVTTAEEWWSFIRKYPVQWQQIVKSLHVTTMELDTGGKSTCGDVVAASSTLHPCSICGSSFTSSRALQSHVRAKHNKSSNAALFVGSSLCCCVCGQSFSTRPRLIAHLTDKRRRGGRKLVCHDVVSAGFVQQVAADEYKVASEADRIFRNDARKRGLTQPRSAGKAKRTCLGFTLYSTSMANSRSSIDRPSNAMDWNSVRPHKRLRTKTRPDDVIAQST